jgi:DNA polymerase-3 subunit epsilon
MPQPLRQNAIRQARQYLAFQPYFLDTETTGLYYNDEIIEIAISDFSGQIVLDTLVKPERSIPIDSQRIHHITNEMVSDSPCWLDVWKQAEEILAGKYIGVYNKDFDIRMLQQTHAIHRIPWKEPGKFFCIMTLYADFSPYARGKYQKLDDAGRQCGIKIPNSHRAKDDTLLAREIFLTMARAI